MSYAYLYSSDHVVLIRKAGYTELYNLDTMRHETGDYIKRDVTREKIYQFIEDHRKVFMQFIDE